MATYEDLKCLRDAGFSFSIFEIYTEGHLLWQEGIKNILTAQRVGFPYINGYHFPKRSQDPTTQVKIVLEALQKANVTFPRVWIDIEGPTWASYTTKQNVDFVNTIRKTYEANGFKVSLWIRQLKLFLKRVRLECIVAENIQKYLDHTQDLVISQFGMPIMI